MRHILIITVIAALKVTSRIFLEFLATKTNNFANYELSKSEKPPMWPVWAVFGHFRLFLGCFGSYIAIYLRFVFFTHLA